jgi:citrate synthase
MDDDLFVDAEEAARALGVNVSTLYAYVSRKHIRSQRVPGSRQCRYWKADIERVVGGGAVQTPARPGGLTRDTDITLITEQGHYYRGRSAIDLAKTFTLEETAALLWQCETAAAFTTDLPRAPRQIGALLKLLSASSAADRATAVFPLLELANPRAFDLTHAGMVRTGADVLRWLAALITRLPQPSADPIHLVVARALGASKQIADAIREVLVLSADHGFEPATYAVRAAASTGLTPYRSVLTGLSVSTGRRTRVGRVERLARLMTEICDATDPQEPVIRRIREGEELPGFGSNLYRHGDPRARAFMPRLDAVFGDDVDFAKLRKAIAVAHDINGMEPDFLLANAYLARRLGLRAGDSLFVLGRAAGWIAHAIEQYQVGGVIREPSMYRGSLPS